MRSFLLQMVLRQHIEHKNQANLRLHIVSNALMWGGLTVWLSQVPVPAALGLPLLGANLGAWFTVASVLWWLALDGLVPLLVLTFTVALASLPGVPWGPGHGLVLGVLLPVLSLLTGGLAAYFSHIYHHEHAEFAVADQRWRGILETTHAVVWGPFHFWLLPLLWAGWRPALRAELDAAERQSTLWRERADALGWKWRNWAGNVRCRPAVLAVPQTLADLEEAVARAAREGRRVRVVGSGFTWSSCVPTDEVLIFCERLSGVELDLSDPEQPAAWVLCGTTNRELDQALARAGLQLPWNVVLETVRVGGIVSTGTHGSGRETATLGDLVLALEIVDARGERRLLSEQTVGAEAMAAVRLGFGVFGVIARVRLRLQPARRVLQIDRRLSLEEALAELPELLRTRDSVELFWFPFTDWLWVRTFSSAAVGADGTSARRAARFWFKAHNFLQMTVSASLLATASRWAPWLLPSLMRQSARGLQLGERELWQSEAIHYRHWLEARRCSCVEVGFKVEPDLGNVRRALLETMDRIWRWAERGRYPVDLAVNLRFTGPSGALLSAAYGSGLTCYIEALCLGRSPDWEACSAELVSAWMQEPTALPHWAKEFEHVPGVVTLCRARLGDRLHRFRAALSELGTDPEGRFRAGLVQRVFFETA